MKLEKEDAIRILLAFIAAGKIDLPATATALKRQREFLETSVPDEEKLYNPFLPEDPVQKVLRVVQRAGRLDAFYVHAFLDGLVEGHDPKNYHEICNFILDSRAADRLLHSLEKTP